MLCKICGNEFANLSSHLKEHNITAKDYYKQYVLHIDEDPVCPTCGKPVPFVKLCSGFRKYCSYTCRNKSETWKKEHNEILLNRYGTTRITDDLKTRQTKNGKTLEKFTALVKDYGTIKNYSDHIFTYHCNKCNEDCEYDYNFFQHRIRYSMNPCRKCQKTLLSFKQCSHAEDALYEFIKANCQFEIIRHNRQILDGRELDIYIPALNLAFEFDGTFWHMDERFYKASDVNSVKGITAEEIWKEDKLKDLKCEEKFIKLFRVKEHDWSVEPELIKSKILTLLSKR